MSPVLAQTTAVGPRLGSRPRRSASPSGSRPRAQGRTKRKDIVRKDIVCDRADEEDLTTVGEFLDGDQRAFEHLFDKYREKVFNIAYRFVRNREDALEVTQEVFLRVYLALPKFKTNSKFFTWLYRIAVNRAIDFTRSRKAQPTVGLDALTLDSWAETSTGRPATVNPVELAQEKELRERLREAIDMLSPKHRAVFVLHAGEKLSYNEIALVLGINIGTVMSRLFYARKKLQEILMGFGFEIPVKTAKTPS